MSNPAENGGAARNARSGLDTATCSKIAAPLQAPFALRPYQRDVVDRVHAAIAAGRRRVLIVCPTGAGKTIIAAAMVRDAVEVGRRCIFLAHRRELIQQAVGKLYDHGIDAGIVQAGFEPRPGQPVQVASIQTLWARAMRTRRMMLPPADLVFVDEAHRCRARTYTKILDSYPEATVLGLTATPCRGDGRGLGNVFDIIVECPPVQELIEGGYPDVDSEFPAMRAETIAEAPADRHRQAGLDRPCRRAMGKTEK